MFTTWWFRAHKHIEVKDITHSVKHSTNSHLCCSKVWIKISLRKERGLGFSILGQCCHVCAATSVQYTIDEQSCEKIRYGNLNKHVTYGDNIIGLASGVWLLVGSYCDEQFENSLLS